VQPGRPHRQHRVARADTVGAEQVRLVDDAGAGAREVVLVGAEQAGVLGGLPPTSAQPARRQPSATPATMAAIRSGTTLPQAM
jgi:hypothetical protein